MSTTGRLALLAGLGTMAWVACGGSDNRTVDAEGAVGGQTGAAGNGPAAGGSGGGAGMAGSPGGSGGSAGGGPVSADTWDGFARPFVERYCVSCHNDDKAGVAARDYHMLAVVMKEKAEIACGVAPSMDTWTQLGCKGFPPPRQFPVGNGPKPTDDERARMVKWIQAGAP